MEVIDNYESGTRSFSTVLTFPEYIPQVTMPIGLLILAGFQLSRLVDAWRQNIAAAKKQTWCVAHRNFWKARQRKRNNIEDSNYGLGGHLDAACAVGRLSGVGGAGGGYVG